MSNGTRLYKVADDAIDRLANAPQVPASDRSMLLSKLRIRVSDAIVRLGTEAERQRAAQQPKDSA